MERKFAILGDIHANWEALSAVLDDARAMSVTDFVCVGDVVGYNASPAECLDAVRECGAVTVRGNHDHYVAHQEHLDDFHPLAASVIDWTRRTLSEDQLQWLAQLPMVRAINGFTIVHGTLDMPEKWGYVFDVLEAEANFNSQTTAVCFHGHTHVPLVFERHGSVFRGEPSTVHIQLGHKYFINTGSIGQPRDGDSRGSYLTYNMKTREIEFRRVEYDIEAAQERNKLVGLPARLSDRLARGR